MADGNGSFIDMSIYSRPNTVVTNKAPAANVVADKKETLSDASRMKTFLLSSPEELHVAATAMNNGNSTPDAQLITDMQTMKWTDLTAKYGAETMVQATKFYGAATNLQKLKDQERTYGQVASDSLIDLGVAGVNTAGAIGILGAQVVDAASNATDAVANELTGGRAGHSTFAAAPLLSKGLGWFNETAKAYHSDVYKAQEAQHALEGALNKQDSEAAYAADTAGKDPGFDITKAGAWFSKQGRDFGNAVTNYGDDPIMLGALVPEMVGSMAPASMAMKAAGKASAMASLAKQGITGDAAAAVLKTASGRALINEGAVKAAPLVIGATEAGSAVSQVQQELMNTPESEMMRNSDYVRMRNDEHLTHDQAMARLASSAGTATATMAFPIAMAAGKLVAKIEANPLAVGSSGSIGSTLRHGAQNALKEAGEETIQEGGNALSGNIGLNWAGQDVSLDRNVAASAAEGMLGGLAGTAGMQGPSVALGTLGEVAKVAGGAVKNAAVTAINGRIEGVMEQINKASAVGKEALTTAADAAAASADAILARVRPTTAPDPVVVDPAAIDPADPAAAIEPTAPEKPDVVSSAVQNAIYLNQDEVTGYADMFPDLVKPDENGQAPTQIRRSDLIAEAGKVVQDTKLDASAKLAPALAILSSASSMQGMEADHVQKALDELPPEEAQVALDHWGALNTYLNKLESSPELAAAKAVVQDLTPEQVDALLPLEDMKAGNLSDDMKGNVKLLLDIVGRVNNGAVNASYYDMVRNQIDPSTITPAEAKSLDLSQGLAQDGEKAAAAKSKINAGQEAAINALPTDAQEAVRSKVYVPKDIVRDQIYDAVGDKELAKKTGIRSLAEHRRVIGEAMAAGRVKEAAVAVKNLRNFATSMVNKVTAINQSSLNNDGKPVPYKAHGPYGAYIDEKGAYAYPKSIKATAYAADVHVDATAVVSLYNRALKAYGVELGLDVDKERMAVPELHERMRKAHDEHLARVAKPEAVEPVKTEEPAPAAETKAEPVAEAKPEPVTEKAPAAVEPVVEVKADPAVEDTGSAKTEAAPVAETAPVDEPAPVTKEAKVEPAPEPTKKNKAASKIWFDWVSKVAMTPFKRTNKFVQSFKAKDNGSSFLEHESAASHIADFANGLVSSGELGLDYDLTEEQADGLRHLMDEVVPKISAEIQKQFTTALTQSRGGKREGSRVSTWINDLETGAKDVLAYKNALTANFAIANEDGQYELEPRVLEAAIMAALEFIILSNSRGRPYLKDEQIAKILGLPRNTKITGQMREIARHGAMLQQALQQVSDTTMSLLGVEGLRGASATYTQGLFKALAGDVLHAMASTDIIDAKQHEPLQTKKGPRYYLSLAAVKDAKESLDPTQVAIRELASLPDVFSQIFLNEHDKTRYIGKPPSKVSSKLIRNPLSAISALQRKVMEDRQKAPYAMNMPLVQLWQAMGTDTLADILGFVDTKGRKFNKVKLEMVEGKNISIMSDLEGVQHYLNAAEAYGNTHGMETSAVKIFFDWAVSSVGRLQQQGPVTPQGNKITRELITITNATVDLLDPEGDAGVLGDLWLAIAQSSGVKIEKLTREDSISKAKSLMLEGKLTPAVDIMLESLRTGEMNQDQKAALKQAIKDSGIAPTMKLIHAIHTVARMELALDQGIEASSNFQTSLAVEADGKTDGPINAIIHMAIGYFTDEWVKTVAKGGLFFGSERKTYNEHVAKDAEDLYNKAGKAFNQTLPAHLKTLEGTAAKYAHAMLRVMDVFLPGFTIGEPTDTGEMTFGIDRSVPKNPLTVFLYGSSVDGISGKVLGEMEGAIYTMLSEVAESGKSWKEHPIFESHPELVKDLHFLLNTTVDKDFNFSKSTKAYATVGDFLEKPEQAELPDRLIESLTFGITKSFGEPLTEAIDDATGNLAMRMKFTQKVSQVQAAIFTDVFNQMLANRLAKYRAETKTDLMLPEADMQDVFREAMRVAPIYETDDMEFHIASITKSDSPAAISENLAGKFAATAITPAPSEASVKVSPYMTIGLGDGQMIMNIYAAEDGSLQATLPVFDGVEIGVDQFRNASGVINKAVFDGWMGSNMYQSLADGYRQMILKTDFDALSKETKESLRRMLQLPKGVDIQFEHLTEIQQQLNELAIDTAARKEAISKINSWTDHMAGAGSPHNNAGELVDGDEVLVRLNEIYAAAKDRMTKETQAATEKPATQKHDHKTLAVVREIGEPVGGFKSVYMLPGKALLTLVTKDLGASPEQIELIQTIEKSGALDNVQVFRGSATELNRLKRKYFKGVFDNSVIQEGQAYVGSGIIFLTNTSTETVVHEAIHMSVSKAVRDFYQDADSVPAHIKDAMQRLEALANEFMKIKADVLPTNMQAAFTTLKNILLNKDLSKAERMDEFLAWTLANQHLTQLAQKVRVHNPLALLTLKVKALLARIIGIKFATDKDLLSNVRFNAAVLGSYKPTKVVADLNSEVEQGLNQLYGEDARLSIVEKQYIDRMQAYLEEAAPKKEGTAEYAEFRADVAELNKMADDAAALAAQQGYGMNARQQAAFTAVHSTLMSGMSISAPILRKANRLFDHVLKNVTENDFLALEGLTQETASDAEYTQAANRVAMLTGDIGYQRTATGRTDMLATFMALAQVHPDMRAVLEKLDAPKDAEIKWDSVDNALRSIATSILNLLTRFSVSRASQPASVTKQLDALSGALTEVQKTHRLITMAVRYNPVELSNQYLADALKTGTEKAVATLDRKANEATDRKVKGAYNLAKMVASLGSKKTSEAAGSSLTKMLNSVDGWHEARALLNDFRGMGNDNRELLRLLNKVKSLIDVTRQDFREQVPELLARAFTRRLKKHEWVRLYSMAQSDLLALGKSEALALMADPGSIQARITAAEAELQKLDADQFKAYVSKSKALARYMIKGEIISNELLRNSYAIVSKVNAISEQAMLKPPADVVAAVDSLISLYAYELLDEPVQATMADLAKSEGNGMMTLTGFLEQTRKAELDRLDRPGNMGDANRARFNGWKGYAPAAVQDGTSVKIADDADEKDLVLRGWKNIGPYKGDPKGNYHGSRSYYINTVGARNAFRQGVAQTVHASWNGVDMRTGLTHSPATSGAIFAAAAEDLHEFTNVALGVRDNLKPSLHMLPVWDANGDIVAYEWPVAADKLTGLSQDKHLGRMLGVWAGRISEENQASEANLDLIKALKTTYDTLGKTEPESFVNIADPKLKDKIYKDAWDTLGHQFKVDAAALYGRKDFFPVRRDMISDAVGYRAAGFTDGFTGNTRWSKETQEKMRKAAIVVLGATAYEKIKRYEDRWQDAVSYMKQNVVIRSLKVVTDNVLGNNYYLLLSGVNPMKILKGNRDKFLEVTAFVKNREDILRLQIELAGLQDDPVKAKVIKARIMAIEDANARMSIQPLIKAGELSTVSENLTEADVAYREGRIAEFIEKHTERLPGIGKTVAKNLLLTKDTALYQGLNRAVQYGDFIAKAILFDHLTKDKGKTEREALDVISEEFVNYNRLAGRGRDFLESIGMLWFYNYKLRITKIAVKMLRDRPLHALTMIYGTTTPLGLDTPFDSSVVGKSIEGSLDYSIGPQMGFHSFGITPLGSILL